MPATARRTQVSKADHAAPSPLKRVRFDSINEMGTWTNDQHIKVLLYELPLMRMGIAVLNMNDRELEANIYTGGPELGSSMLDLVASLTTIRNRHQAGIDLCNAASERILHVLERLQAES